MVTKKTRVAFTFLRFYMHYGPDFEILTQESEVNEVKVNILIFFFPQKYVQLHMLTCS